MLPSAARRTAWAGLAGSVACAILATAADLRAEPATLIGCHAILLGVLALGIRSVRQGGAPAFRVALLFALIFRGILVLAPPTLSDDVWRYVWDGRVQASGVHPYRYPPDAPELRDLRDEDWTRINHREVATIYPPLAQLIFAGMARLGAGATGYKTLMAGCDLAVVAALTMLVRRVGAPRERVLLYAWNPLAVVETAGSGHLEPVAIALGVGAVAALASARRAAAGALLGAAIQAKLLPVVLVPGFVRRLPLGPLAILATFCAGLALPYAASGPAIGSGTWSYARHWEYNAFAFAGIRAALLEADAPARASRAIEAGRARIGEGFVPWDALARRSGIGDLSRAVSAALAMAWIVLVAFRPGLDPVREAFLTLGGVLLLSPTFHPWYALWPLPFAAALGSRGWILLAALQPIAYATGPGDVPLSLRLLLWVPPVGLMLHDGLRSRPPSPSAR